jgi:hypothetical protein
MTEYTFRMHYSDGSSYTARDGVLMLREVAGEVVYLFIENPYCEYIMVLKNGKPHRCVIRNTESE